MTKEMNTANASDKALGISSDKTGSVKGTALSEVLTQVELSTLMGKGVPLATQQTEVVVMPCKTWLTEVSANILQAVYMYDNKIPKHTVNGVEQDLVTVESLTEYLYWVILNRVNYLHHGRNEVHPRSVEYPTVMYDALARLTRYDGAKKDGALVVPTLNRSSVAISDETRSLLGMDAGTTCWIKNDKVIAFPNHDKFASYLKTMGVHMATGLPMSRTSEIRTLYEMDINDTAITTAGAVPSVSEVFARCYYSFEALTSLVGVQKVELLLYNTLTSKLFDVVKEYVRNFRNG